MLYRGTTPYHSFALPLSQDNISELYVTYMQNNQVIVERSLDDIELRDVDTITGNGFITDQNSGDSFSSNDANPQETEEVVMSEAIIHLTQEETLAFTFYPAAEKNIIVIQIRVLDTNGEAYASEPIRERLYGVLKDGVI